MIFFLLFTQYMSHKKRCIQAFKSAIINVGMSCEVSDQTFLTIVLDFLGTLTFSDILLVRDDKKCFQIEYTPLRKDWILRFQEIKYHYYLMNTTSTLSSNFSSRRMTVKPSVLTILTTRTLIYPNPNGRVLQNTIACSALGDCIAFCASGNIYNSTNYGSTFTLTTLTTGVNCIVMNGDGQYQVAISTGDPLAVLYLSANSGVTWVLKISPATAPTPTRLFESASIDSSGRYIIALGGGSAMLRNYYSTNFGATFAMAGALGSRNTCAVSNEQLKTAYYVEYWGNTLKKVDLTNPAFTEIALGPSAVTLPFSLTTTGSKVAYLSRNTVTPAIAFSSNEGATFVTKTSPVFLYIMYTGNVLWGCSTTAIQRSDNDGNTWTIVVSALPTIKSFCVSATMSHIYFVFVNGNIGSYNLR